MYGQVSDNEIASATDPRGVVSPEVAARMRKVRSAEEWQRYDSIVIGPGAASRDNGWFDSWAGFADASELQWFSGRSSNVGLSYTNQTTERTDWAQDLHFTSVEFIAPTGLAQYEEQSLDADFTPLFFTQTLPQMLGLRVTLADSDEIAKAPASHFPGRYGVSYPVISGAAAPSTFAGNNGEPVIQNGWRWPVPIMLAAKAKITVTARIDQPASDLLRQLPDPGHKLVPRPDGSIIRVPNWYIIRITHAGPRYLQLRGMRSSA